MFHLFIARHTNQSLQHATVLRTFYRCCESKTVFLLLDTGKSIDNSKRISELFQLPPAIGLFVSRDYWFSFYLCKTRTTGQFVYGLLMDSDMYYLLFFNIMINVTSSETLLVI